MPLARLAPSAAMPATATTTAPDLFADTSTQCDRARTRSPRATLRHKTSFSAQHEPTLSPSPTAGDERAAFSATVVSARVPRLRPVALQPQQLRSGAEPLEFLASLAHLEIAETRVRDGVTYYALDAFCHRFDTHLPARLSDLRRRAGERALSGSGSTARARARTGDRRDGASSSPALVSLGARRSSSDVGISCVRDADLNAHDATNTYERSSRASVASNDASSCRLSGTSVARSTDLDECVRTEERARRVERRFSDFCRLRADVYELACLAPHFRCALCNEFVAHVRFARHQPRALAKLTTGARRRKRLLGDFVVGLVRLALQYWPARKRACTSHDGILALLASFVRDQEPGVEGSADGGISSSGSDSGSDAGATRTSAMTMATTTTTEARSGRRDAARSDGFR